MKRGILIGIILLFLPGTSANATSYSESRDATATGQYGITNPETMGAGEGIITVTRHTRFGQQTGIGGSTMQTTSATREEMPTSIYRPTSMSPAIPPAVSIPALNEPLTFSRRMQSPAFSAPQTNFTYSSERSYVLPGSLDQLQGASPGSRTLEQFMGRKSRGNAFQRSLINPLEGL